MCFVFTYFEGSCRVPRGFGDRLAADECHFTEVSGKCFEVFLFAFGFRTVAEWTHELWEKMCLRMFGPTWRNIMG